MAEKRTKTPCISVIVPTYNAQDYLDDMMASLINQTFSDVEFIFVNDGSNDNTHSLLLRWAAKDERVVVIDKPNGGVASARNAGLDIATGEYVFFHDCDDYSFPDMLDTMYREIEGRDFLVAGWLKSPRSTAFTDVTRKNQVTHRVTADNIKELQERQPHCGWIGTVWRCLFKRDVIEKHKLRFRFRKVNHEDELFIYEFLSHINSAVRIDYEGYVYFDNPGSIGKNHKYNANIEWMQKAEDVLTQCLSRLDPDRNTHLSELFNHTICVIGTSMVTTGYHADSWMSFAKRMERWRYLYNSSWFQTAGKQTKNKLERVIWIVSHYRLYYLADPFLLMLTRLYDWKTCR
ncbi:MAG: glycosyltransferase [Bacteroidaceae bacterium]|nr:glycosyltransferase [Bacteroidaceae bacterium]